MKKVYLLAAMGALLSGQAHAYYPVLPVAKGGTGVTSLGNTLSTAGGVLNTSQPPDRVVIAATDTITSSDCGSVIQYNRSSAIAVSLAAASTTGLTQGCTFTINNIGVGTVTVTPTTSTVNGSATLAVPQNTGCLVRSDSTNYQVDMSACTAINGTNVPSGNAGGDLSGTYPNPTVASVGGDTHVSFLDVAQSWTKAQRGTPVTVAISTATFTPDFSTGNNFALTLVHASCPCTLATPSNPVAGQSGIIIVNQSATGSDLINTYGTVYKFAGGTHPTLSTGASAVDILSYYVVDSTHIELQLFGANFQ